MFKSKSFYRRTTVAARRTEKIGRNDIIRTISKKLKDVVIVLKNGFWCGIELGTIVVLGMDCDVVYGERSEQPRVLVFNKAGSFQSFGNNSLPCQVGTIRA